MNRVEITLHISSATPTPLFDDLLGKGFHLVAHNKVTEEHTKISTPPENIGEETEVIAIYNATKLPSQRFLKALYNDKSISDIRLLIKR